MPDELIRSAHRHKNTAGVRAVKRYYHYDGIAKKCGSQIPMNAEIEVIKFLPKRRAIIQYGNKRFMTSALCCWRKPENGKA